MLIECEIPFIGRAVYTSYHAKFSTNLSILSEPSLNGMDQWGAMVGTYQDSSLNVEREIYLRSLRQRRWGQRNSSTLHR